METNTGRALSRIFRSAAERQPKRRETRASLVPTNALVAALRWAAPENEHVTGLGA